LRTHQRTLPSRIGGAVEFGRQCALVRRDASLPPTRRQWWRCRTTTTWLPI